MLIKKILVVICLIIPITACFASENIISSLIINGSEEREIDIVMDKNKMYLPCKYILNYFEIPYKESHVDKTLSFKNCTISVNSCKVDGIKQHYPVFFLKNGITGSQNEFFMSAEALSKILGKNITSNPKELLAYIKTKESTAKSNDEDPFLKKSAEPKVEAHDEITFPTQKGKVSVDSIQVRDNVLNDSYAQIYKDTQSKYVSFSNNVQTTLAGKLNSGDYKVDFGTNSYTQNMFAFSGISPQYKNQFKNTKYGKIDYVLGKADPWDFGAESISMDLLGVQFKDHVDPVKTYKDIDGYVKSTSTVKVYINKNYEKELNTYGGYYSLRDVYYNGRIHQIRIEELLADGTKKEIFNKTYKEDISQKPVPKRDLIFGINGLQQRMWANNGYLYQMATKKYVLGFKHYKKLSEKLTFENFVAADRIFEDSENSIWDQSVFGGKRYLNYGVIRNLNALEGQTYMGVLSYKNNERYDSRFYWGCSNCTSKDTISSTGFGYLLQCDNNYIVNKNSTLKGSVFASSPSFYMAGSSSFGGAFMSDKVGASFGGNTEFKKVSLSARYSKYKSNFGNYFEGGLLTFDEIDWVSRFRFKKAPSVTFRINNKKGVNTIGEIDSEAYDLTFEKRFKNFDTRFGVMKNVYANKYKAMGYSSYNSEYSNIYAETNFPILKDLGTMGLGHNIVEMKSDATTTDYREIKLSYTTPSVKGVNLSLSTGLHYAGTVKGNDWGIGVTKRLKSGSTVSLNYRYTQVPFYMIDNILIPSSMHHSVTLDFAELYGIGSHGPQAIGLNNENKGYIEANAFLDLNQDGIREKDEPYIENIPIKVENNSEILLTGKNGRTNLKAEDTGVYKIEIYEDELPTFISCHNKTKPCRYVKIDNNSKTEVGFGLISSVGNINGSVTVKDELGHPLKIDDLVVSIIDTSGKELSYTNINEDGTFSFSGLSPGKYLVQVDKELQQAHRIAPYANSENYIVTIPPEYKDYVTVDNVNLYYHIDI